MSIMTESAPISMTFPLTISPSRMSLKGWSWISCMVTVGFRPSVSLAAVRSPRPSRASGCLSLIFIPGCSSWRRSYGDKVLRCRRMGPHPQCANLFHHLFTQLTVAPPGLLAVGLRRQPERPTEVDRYGTQPGDPFPARQDVVGALHVYWDPRTAGACRQKSNPPLRLQQSHPIPTGPFGKHEEHLSLREEA